MQNILLSGEITSDTHFRFFHVVILLKEFQKKVTGVVATLRKLKLKQKLKTDLFIQSLVHAI